MKLFTLYVNGFYNSDFTANDAASARKVAIDKAKLYGGDNYVTLYDEGGKWYGDYCKNGTGLTSREAEFEFTRGF